MNPGKQSTLFQTWGKKETASAPKKRPRVQSTCFDDVIDLCDKDDEEDALLAKALEESLLSAEVSGRIFSRSPGQGTSSSNCHPNLPSTSNTNRDDFLDQPSLSQIEDLPGFDKAAGRIWIYPTNYPVREYQFNIVSKCLFQNTLVTLPTGLGKTFIAAVVMYNFYRWYPQGKVVFMAPTKPLVAQQIEACYNIVGIPQEDTAEMTGTMVPNERLKAWNYKRVFFLTPQVLTNDLSRGACPSADMRCLVIDEAHKALGNHAYCQVVRELVKYTRDFRVLALSATPGSDIKAVQQVVANLLISHIELRTEESIDIQPYVHERKVTKIVVPLGPQLTAIKEKYIRVMDVIVKRLTRQRVLYNRQTTSLSKFMILKAREAFRQNPPQELQRNQYGCVEGDFAIAMSLYHGYELLQLHGLKSLYFYLDGLVSGDKGYGRTRSELNRNGDFRELMEELHGMFGNQGSGESSNLPFALSQRQTPKQPFVSGHPKMEKLKEVVLNHFTKYQADGSTDTRIMIFSQYRDSVNEITDMLSRHRPVVKVMSFIGQSSAGKATKGFTQKEQLKVMKKFREGGYNTLVSTCVGEEGLDIGDVDLIICFDASKSPIRLVQRMGRTGRKREGNIVMLMTEGKEEQLYNQSQYSKKSIHKAILNGAKSLQFYPHSARLVPSNLEPKCHKMHITVQKTFVSAVRGRGDKSGSKGDKSASKNQKITGLLDQPVKKLRKSDGLLTESELSYWSEHYKIPEEETPSFPDSQFKFFKKKGQKQTLENMPEDTTKGLTLRLAEWMPWQNRLQPTVKTGHSMKTEHLVEMMEFIELQQIVGDDGSYDTEMAAYFNKDFILDQEKDTGITKYCTVLAEADDNFDNQSKPKKPSRRSDTLPTFDSDSNSDQELPTFLNDSSSKEEERVSVKENKGKKHCNESNKEQSEKLNVRAQPTKSKKRKLKQISKSKENDRKQFFKSKTGKKRLSSETRSVVEIILDDDSQDFDMPVKTGPNEVELNIDGVEEMETEQQSPDDTNEGEMNAEMIRLSQLLPNFTKFGTLLNSPGFLSGSCERSDKHISTPDHTSCYRYSVPSPPPIEEFENVFSEIDSPSCFKSIDILQLIDEWEREKQISKGSNSVLTKVSPDEVSSPVLQEQKRHKVSVCSDDIRISFGEKTCTKNLFGSLDNVKENIGQESGHILNNPDPMLTGEIICYPASRKPTKDKPAFSRYSSDKAMDLEPSESKEEDNCQESSKEDNEQAISFEDKLYSEQMLLQPQKTDGVKLHNVDPGESVSAKEPLNTACATLQMDEPGESVNAKERQKTDGAKLQIDESRNIDGAEIHSVETGKTVSAKEPLKPAGAKLKIDEPQNFEGAEIHSVETGKTDTAKKTHKTDGAKLQIDEPQNFEGAEIHSVETGITDSAKRQGEAFFKTKTSQNCSSYADDKKLIESQGFSAIKMNAVNNDDNSAGCREVDMSMEMFDDPETVEEYGDWELGLSDNDSNEPDTDRLEAMNNIEENVLGKRENITRMNDAIGQDDRKSVSGQSSTFSNIDDNKRAGVNNDRNLRQSFDSRDSFVTDNSPGMMDEQAKGNKLSVQGAKNNERDCCFNTNLDSCKGNSQGFHTPVKGKSIEQAVVDEDNLTNQSCDLNKQSDSPVFNPVPFKRYRNISGGKSTPVARVLPLGKEKMSGVLDESLLNDEEDLFFSDFKTPQSIRKSADSRTPGKLNESQITFSQALACLHDSPAPVVTGKHLPTTKSDISLIKSPHGARQTACTSSDIKSPIFKSVGSPKGDNPAEESLPTIGDASIALFQDSDSDSNDRPQFELDYNLDDVIPPSPVHEQSMCNKTLNKCSQSIIFGKKKTHSFMETTHSTTQQDFDFFTIPFEESVVFPKRNIPKKKSDSTNQNDFEDLTMPPEESDMNFETEPCSISNPTTENDYGDFTMEESVVFPERKPPQHFLPESEDIPVLPAVSPKAHNQRDGTPTSPVFTPRVSTTALRKKHTFQTEEISSDSDDEVVGLRRRGSKIQLIDSPVVQNADKEMCPSPSKPSEFKTPLQPPSHRTTRDRQRPSSSKNLDFSSESEESPVIVKKSKSKHVVIDDDDDDFADSSVKRVMSAEKIRSEVKTTKVKKKRPGCQFIVNEAELSDDGASDVSEDEEDCSQMDGLLDGFINDCSQMTQPPADHDDQAMYLRSVQSPLVSDRDGVYRRDRPSALEVCSQVSPPDYSEYLEDSFCVLGEEEELSDLGEISCFYSKPKQKRKPPRKRKAREIKKLENVGRKRVMIAEGSSSEEDTKLTKNIPLISPDKLSDNLPVHRGRLLSSSEEEIGKGGNPDKREVVQDTCGFSPPMLSLRSRLQKNATEKSTYVPENNISKYSTSSVDTNSENKFLSNQQKSLSNNECVKRTDDTGENLYTGHAPKLKTPAELREERLRKQREKQEEFKKRMAAKKEKEDSLVKPKTSPVSMAFSNNEDIQSNDTCDFTSLVRKDESYLPSDSSLITSPKLRRDTEKKMVIFVDSREITSGQEVVSHLRVSQKFNVVVRQLSGCDYILSNRLAVERKQWADFSNGSNRSKLQERIQSMCSLFDRQYLVIEKDRVKPGEEKSARPQVRTKYVDSMLAWLAQSSVRVFFTDTQEETANLLSDFCQLEERKGMAVYLNPDLNPFKQQMLKFFTSLPKISYITALNLCHNINNLREFTKSSTKSLQLKGQMSEGRASDLKEFIQHEFCLSMVPASHQ